MKRNLEKTLQYMPDFFSLVKPSATYNYIIKYILNHSKINYYLNISFINDSNIFSNFDSSFYILNNIKNNKASTFIMDKIKKLFLAYDNI